MELGTSVSEKEDEVTECSTRRPISRQCKRGVSYASVSREKFTEVARKRPLIKTELLDAKDEEQEQQVLFRPIRKRKSSVSRVSLTHREERISCRHERDVGVESAGDVMMAVASVVEHLLCTVEKSSNPQPVAHPQRSPSSSPASSFMYPDLPNLDHYEMETSEDNELEALENAAKCSLLESSKLAPPIIIDPLTSPQKRRRKQAELERNMKEREQKVNLNEMDHIRPRMHQLVPMQHNNTSSSFEFDANNNVKPVTVISAHQHLSLAQNNNSERGVIYHPQDMPNKKPPVMDRERARDLHRLRQLLFTRMTVRELRMFIDESEGRPRQPAPAPAGPVRRTLKKIRRPGAGEAYMRERPAFPFALLQVGDYQAFHPGHLPLHQEQRHRQNAICINPAQQKIIYEFTVMNRENELCYNIWSYNFHDIQLLHFNADLVYIQLSRPAVLNSCFRGMLPDMHYDITIGQRPTVLKHYFRLLGNSNRLQESLLRYDRFHFSSRIVTFEEFFKDVLNGPSARDSGSESDIPTSNAHDHYQAPNGMGTGAMQSCQQMRDMCGFNSVEQSNVPLLHSFYAQSQYKMQQQGETRPSMNMNMSLFDYNAGAANQNRSEIPQGQGVGVPPMRGTDLQIGQHPFSFSEPGGLSSDYVPGAMLSVTSMRRDSEYLLGNLSASHYALPNPGQLDFHHNTPPHFQPEQNNNTYLHPGPSMYANTQLQMHEFYGGYGMDATGGRGYFMQQNGEQMAQQQPPPSSCGVEDNAQTAGNQGSVSESCLDADMLFSIDDHKDDYLATVGMGAVNTDAPPNSHVVTSGAIANQFAAPVDVNNGSNCNEPGHPVTRNLQQQPAEKVCKSEIAAVIKEECAAVIKEECAAVIKEQCAAVIKEECAAVIKEECVGNDDEHPGSLWNARQQPNVEPETSTHAVIKMEVEEENEQGTASDSMLAAGDV